VFNTDDVMTLIFADGFLDLLFSEGLCNTWFYSIFKDICLIMYRLGSFEPAATLEYGQDIFVSIGILENEYLGVAKFSYFVFYPPKFSCKQL